VKAVWSSFEGRYSDSPRALYEALRERPDVEHTWLAAPEQLHGFPSDVATVVPDSEEGRAALEAADLVVASSHIRVEWDKSPATTYVQTWHGTPLKRVHHDVLWAPEGLLDYLDKDVAKWDLLLSPNAVSTPRLTGAFAYDGEVLESGYPRNDLLLSPGRQQARQQQREAFGIRDEQRVVLYAPTWRDDEVQADDPKPIPLALDPGEFTDVLGDDHVLLIRAHNMVRHLWEVEHRPTVHDVSQEPDVRLLLNAADVLVTDYSTLMFDFAITGRPLVFHAYDLEKYAAEIRGFYFDLVAEAPGPVVRTSSEVVDAIAHLPEVQAEYAAAYAAFQERYTYLEDGHATDRVLARLGL
jgi:CDP-glycerol glycerophosphotransferase